MTDSIRKLHKWECMETGYRKADTMQPEMLVVVDKTSTDMGPRGFGILTEHVWRIKFGLSFSCTEAELHEATKLNAQRLMHHIYGPMEDPIREAMSAAFGGDREQVIKSLTRALNLIEDK